jgi:hypothetical protein
VLSEDLRSSIVVSQGRGRLNVYADSLFEAVKVWRLSGAWRSKYKKAAAPVGAVAVPNPAETQIQHRVISLLEHRQKSAGRVAGRSDSAAALGERAAKSRS